MYFRGSPVSRLNAAAIAGTTVLQAVPDSCWQSCNGRSRLFRINNSLESNRTAVTPAFNFHLCILLLSFGDCPAPAL
jgi:hypothetical protein